MSDLTKSIKTLYETELNEAEAIIAESSLLGFFRLLENIELRLIGEREILFDQSNEY